VEFTTLVCPCGATVEVRADLAAQGVRCPKCARALGEGGAAPPEKVACRFCAELIPLDAKTCPLCGTALDAPPAAPPPPPKPPGYDALTVTDWILAAVSLLACSLLGIILGIIYLAQGRSKAGGLLLAAGLVGIGVGFLPLLVMALAKP
jgi:hypothetical protein